MIDSTDEQGTTTAPASAAEPADDRTWDLLVVGAGPAGATAARVAAEAGLSVLLVERAALPRYKTCGGGLIGYSRKALPADFQVPVRQTITAITFSHNGRKSRTKRDREAVLFELVNRADFDHALTEAAVKAGAVLRERTSLTRLTETDDLVTALLGDGSTVLARAVVGADGSAGRTGRYVGVRCDQIDLGLEAEIPVPPEVAAQWAGRLLIDWGPVPGSYGWVFPKGDVLTVGVIAARNQGGLVGSGPGEGGDEVVDAGAGVGSRVAAGSGAGAVAGSGSAAVAAAPTSGSVSASTSDRPAGHPVGVDTRAYYRDFIDRLGLAGYPPLTDSGHLTRCRTTDSPLVRGRVLVAGDAAGLLEPWTREGISYALRSGRLAGLAAVGLSEGRPAADVGAEYTRQVESTLGGEMATGKLLLAAFIKHPGFFHTAITTLPPAWKAFTGFCRGRISLEAMARSRTAQIALRSLS